MVASNGPAAEQKSRMNNADLSKYFSNFYISEEIGVNKPDSKFFNVIFESLDNKDKSSFLMIGDDLTSDIKGAINAGIDSCWINKKCEKNSLGINPTFTIKSLKELLVCLVD